MKSLYQKIQDQDVEILSLKVSLTEKEGLIYAISSHNMALIKRVEELAVRLESHI